MKNKLTTAVANEQKKVTISKFNALKHGILRESMTSYEKGFYDNVLNELQDEYNPKGFIEQILLERIAISYLKLFRVQKAETEYIKSKLKPHIEGIDDSYKHLSRVIQKGYKPQIVSENVEKLSNIYSRYETTIENRLFRALHELERAQRTRKGEKLLQPVVVDVNQISSFGEKGYEDE